MKRRDFLFLAHAGDGCVRVSCEQLYMYYRDLTQSPAVVSGASPKGAEWWAGEPESDLALETPEAFFNRLGEALRGKRRLELSQPEWLGDARLRQEMEQLMNRFRASGGEVVFLSQTESSGATA